MIQINGVTVRFPQGVVYDENLAREALIDAYGEADDDNEDRVEWKNDDYEVLTFE